MRIGMGIDVYRSYLSGVTQYVAQVTSCLKEKGHDVFIFTFDNSGNISETDPTIIASPAVFSSQRYSWGLLYTPRARKLLREMDVIHIHHPFVSGPLIKRYSRGRIPLVFTNHTRYDIYLKSYVPWLNEKLGKKLLLDYYRLFANSVDQVIAPSQGMLSVIQSWGIRTPIEVIPNGINLEPFLHPAARIERRDLGTAKDDFVWVYVGRISPEKNLDLLLDSFTIYLKEFPRAVLLVIGDGPLLQKLKERVRAQELEAQVRFTGQVEHPKIPAYLSTADAFITASISEVHPLTLIEALACGLPLVGITSPGIGDIIENGVNGYLSTQDKGELAAKMLALSSDPLQYQAMKRAAQISAEKYSIEGATERLIDLYQRVMNDHPCK